MLIAGRMTACKSLGLGVAVEPVTVVTGASALAESVNALKAALEAIPTDGRRRRTGQARRLDAYLMFQRAAHEAAVWPSWLGVLEAAARSKAISSAEVFSDLAGCRSATSALLTALSEIRLVGNPAPRRLAEEIVTLLIELMEVRLPGVPEDGIRFRIARRIYNKIDHEKAMETAKGWLPGFVDIIDDTAALLDDEARKSKAEYFNNCQLALGTWHKRFTLAARKDLGYGPRKWHIGRTSRTAPWQIWRPLDQWPGGWPPPEARDLIGLARAERMARVHSAPPRPTVGDDDLNRPLG
jgi:hypothetical protein